MKYSLSITKGKGNIKHNNRTQSQTTKNVDKSRSKNNVYMSSKDLNDLLGQEYTLEQFYHYHFDDAVADYNEKQKRKDRMIDNYYKKTLHDKKTKLFQELVVQIGNKDEVPSDELAKKILREFVHAFKKANPQMPIFKAYIHLDESTPHLHLDYVPIASYTRGLKKRVSNDRAIKQMGYDSWLDWKDKQFELLESICNKNDIERDVKDNFERHRSLDWIRNQNNAIQIENNNIMKKALSVQLEKIDVPTVAEKPKTHKIPLIGELVEQSDYENVLELNNIHIENFKRLEEKVEALDRSNCLLEQQNDKLMEDLRTRDKELHDFKQRKYVKEYEKAKQESDKFIFRNIGLEREIKTLKKERDTLTSQNSKLTSQNDELISQNDELISQNKELKEELQDQESRFTRLINNVINVLEVFHLDFIADKLRNAFENNKPFDDDFYVSNSTKKELLNTSIREIEDDESRRLSRRNSFSR